MVPEIHKIQGSHRLQNVDLIHKQLRENELGLIIVFFKKNSDFFPTFKIITTRCIRLMISSIRRSSKTAATVVFPCMDLMIFSPPMKRSRTESTSNKICLNHNS